MPRIPVAAKRRYNAAVPSSPVALPDGPFTRFRTLAERDAWPDTGGDVVRVITEVSYNNGPWQFLCGFTAAGGNHFRKDGTPVTHSWQFYGRKDEEGNPLPVFAQNSGRRVRVLMEPIVPIDSALDVEID